MCCMMQILNLMLKSVRMLNMCIGRYQKHTLAYTCKHSVLQSKGCEKCWCRNTYTNGQTANNNSACNRKTECEHKRPPSFETHFAAKNALWIREIELDKEREREENMELQYAICTFFVHADKYSQHFGIHTHTHPTVAHQFTKTRTHERDKSVPKIECKPNAYHIFSALYYYRICDALIVITIFNESE